MHEEVAKCGVLLAVIGPSWLDAHDEHGNRRLDDSNDFVPIEIAADAGLRATTRAPTHGYAEREVAMAAFAKSWRREAV